jgi:signal recognition particle subunit SRP54
MFEAVAQGFRAAKHKLTGKAQLTEENIDDALRDIRVALLEADVEYGVAKKFIADVKEKALGEVVALSAKKGGAKLVATPGDHFVKICHDELEALMGPVDTSLRFREVSAGPTVIMMVGLQGSGKTTTTGKLAGQLGRKGKKPLLVAADIYRPAAVDQLKVLGEKLKVPVHAADGVSPVDLCRQGVAEARRLGRDVVILDTAGRLAIDESMMQELEGIKAACKPDNVLLVVDAMIGQDAVRTAAEFDRRLDVDGFVVTKLDGDARGGAALSIKQVTGKPIKFLGTGEKLDRLEEFRPDGLAGRILGFGDIVGLMKDFEEVVDEKRAEQDAEKILSGNFNMEDFIQQIRLVKQMGPIGEIMEKLPLFGDMQGVKFDDKELGRVEAIVSSMTVQERRRPELINASRVRRIARGAGRHPNEVQGLLERFGMMRKMMRQIGDAPGLLSRLPGFKQLSQLNRMRGMKMDDLLGDMFGGAGGLPGMGGMGLPGMGPNGLPANLTGGQAAALAQARRFGVLPQGGSATLSKDERKRIEERRKKEKANKKNARKK